MNNIGKWKCTNPECPDVKQGICYASGSPSYERKTCATCGALMNRFAGADAIILIASEGAKALMPSGYLPVSHLRPGMLQRMFGVASSPSISDPDVSSYADLRSAQNDPRILHPNLHDYLQRSDLFLVRHDERPATVAVVRCPSHDLAKPIAAIQEVAIHVEAVSVKGYTIFAVYPLLYDAPGNPFFAECACLPYDMVDASQQECSHRMIYGYYWRKLFYLLTQSETVFIILDEHHRVVGTRTAHVRSVQRRHFETLLSGLEQCAGKKIDKQTSVNIHTEFSQETKIEAIQSRFPKLE